MDPDAHGPEHCGKAGALDNVEKPNTVAFRSGRPCSNPLPDCRHLFTLDYLTVSPLPHCNMTKRIINRATMRIRSSRHICLCSIYPLQRQQQGTSMRGLSEQLASCLVTALCRLFRLRLWAAAAARFSSTVDLGHASKW